MKPLGFIDEGLADISARVVYVFGERGEEDAITTAKIENMGLWGEWREE